MVPFLKQVVKHYISAGDISRRCFIFPNRRSMVFFRKWLGDALASSDDARPVISPQMLTVNDLFCRLSGLYAADTVALLLELYESYCRVNPKAESLDEFIFWGNVILADFNDVDKYDADPQQVFANISDFKAIQDDFSYLSERQREAVENFISHFSDRSGKLTVDLESSNPDVKVRFLHIWNILYPLYLSFNEALVSKGMAYEGMLYRKVAESLDQAVPETFLSPEFSQDQTFVFIGLNALNECEKKLLRKLRDWGKAEFCWDWTGEMMKDPRNRASVFMTDNVREFPQAFTLEMVQRLPSFNVLSVPSSYGQVKHVAGILDKVGFDSADGSACSDTAVVLPDEGLLLPLLNSIPENVHDINVTMGYPMSACRMSVLMSDLAKLQMHVRLKGKSLHFYHRQVWDILSSGLLRLFLESEGMQESRARVDEIRRQAKYYVPEEDFASFPVLEKIFRPVVKDITAADPSQTDALAEYLQEMAAYVAGFFSGNPEMALELEFARKYYNSINALRAKKLAVLPSTFVRLLDSLMSGMTVPFRGEPLKGLQVMGPLETRALDFRNVIILSCNEGMFPRRNVSSSFIPPELRKAFSLPTYEHQDAIWAYYFYRMISRAENVWMLFDSRTEGLKRGEESRYIKQLRYHYGVEVDLYTADASLEAEESEDDVVQKTEAMMDIIDGLVFSASALQNYVICPARFCYQSVLKLNRDKDVAESLDNAMIGNVYHNVMWALFHSEEAMLSDLPAEKLAGMKGESMRKVSRGYLESWLARDSDIRAKVTALMKDELNMDEISGRDIVVQRVIVRYVMETIAKDISLMDKYGTDEFEVIGLERKVFADIHGARFFGVIDRIDSLQPGMVRLVDYKSGADDPAVIAVSDDNAEAHVEKIFDAEYRYRKEYKAALQFYIYERMARESGLASPSEFICRSMYSTSDMFRNVPAVIRSSSRFDELMDERLKNMIAEIKDSKVPFRRSQETDACRYCDFKMICGR